MADLAAGWRRALSKSSKAAFGRLSAVLGASDVNESTWEDLEALLIQADVGMQTASEVLGSVREAARKGGFTRGEQVRRQLAEELRKRLVVAGEADLSARPSIVLVVGVNGSGKTTTIAKLASMFKSQGKSVLLGAADTFRAAAVDQLQIWADRVQVGVVAGGEGGDPGAVAFNAVQAGRARGADIILIDTAGRLHTRYNLMEELKKVARVVAKAEPGAPHAVWLVLDATTGQNALAQARAFKEAVAVTGVILAKLDASARGGMAFAIQSELGLPILFAGVGEKLEDIRPFDADAFVSGILD